VITRATNYLGTSVGSCPTSPYICTPTRPRKNIKEKDQHTSQAWRSPRSRHHNAPCPSWRPSLDPHIMSNLPSKAYHSRVSKDRNGLSSSRCPLSSSSKTALHAKHVKLSHGWVRGLQVQDIKKSVYFFIV
jgi:hypothetical protein